MRKIRKMEKEREEAEWARKLQNENNDLQRTVATLEHEIRTLEREISELRNYVKW
jgi:uncharacterized protein YlxW (UPF0749 family)